MTHQEPAVTSLTQKRGGMGNSICTRSALALIAAFAFGQSIAQAPAPFEPVDTTAKMIDGVTLHGDVVYATVRGFRPLTLDVYVPASKATRPLVIFVHGGAWAGGSARSAEIVGEDWPRLLASLSARGFVVASISYRLLEEAKFPAQAQDLNAAIRFLRGQASTYGIDPARVVLWGASAGAQIAALASLDCNAQSLGLSNKSSTGAATCVSAVVDWFGPTEFPAATPSPTVVAYLGCRPDACAESWKQAGPLNHVTAAAPPFLIVHGDADTLVPIAQSEALAAALRKAGGNVELKIVREGSHLFRGAARPEIDSAIKRTFDFIEERTRRR